MFALRTTFRSLLPLQTRAFTSSTPSFSTESEIPKLTKGEQILFDKLTNTLSGAIIDVQDVSGGCGSFYSINIKHESFKGMSVIKQHRKVNEILKEEITEMHGLQLKTSA